MKARKSGIIDNSLDPHAITALSNQTCKMGQYAMGIEYQGVKRVVVSLAEQLINGPT